jgi:hypothetical protein
MADPFVAPAPGVSSVVVQTSSISGTGRFYATSGAPMAQPLVEWRSRTNSEYAKVPASQSPQLAALGWSLSRDAVDALMSSSLARRSADSIRDVYVSDVANPEDSLTWSDFECAWHDLLTGMHVSSSRGLLA